MRESRAVVILNAALVIICLTLVALSSSRVAAQAASPDPAVILAAAREAIGGEKQIAALKTLIITGRTRQVRGDNLVPIEFEISCEFPDKYIRRDEIPAQENGPTTAGFAGDTLIQVPPLPTGPGRAGAPAPSAAQLEAARTLRATALKQDFARLMLGLFAQTYSGYPLTFTYFGTAEAPQGQADVLDVKGAGTFAAKFFIYKTTHLPVMLSWQPGPAGAGRGIPGRGVLPPGAAPASPPPTGGAPQATAPPETRLYFADYRDVDGLKLPFRIRRAIGADTVEETTFDRFRFNAKIDSRKFEVK
jgi:hypothetical protein